MWSEENISEEFMWIKIFPQLAAVAERGWREGMVSLSSACYFFQTGGQITFYDLLKYYIHSSGKISGKVHRGTLSNQMHSKMILRNFDTV